MGLGLDLCPNLQVPCPWLSSYPVCLSPKTLHTRLWTCARIPIPDPCQDIPSDAVTAEIPTATQDVYTADGVQGLGGEEEGGLQRARARKTVVYSDNFTEKQFLRMVESKADEEEKSKREKKQTLGKDVYQAMMKIYNAVKVSGCVGGRGVKWVR